MTVGSPTADSHSGPLDNGTAQNRCRRISGRRLLRQNNAVTRAYRTYPTEDNRIHLRSLQRAVKERVSELRKDNRQDLMEDISPFHQAYWRLTIVLK
ncbi:hypothetical protein EVAR_12816_1 [Eumeta japonica]|uniref:Uncharacterized protein n=1 Tax=Eumeta variegata TaxID=151549 RepID=A0A4C1UAT8_EUMVA|nr:hypothetical protein EVAR_12816_1 [Eumeta japonica]